jgi:gas vesicle structural protein
MSEELLPFDERLRLVELVDRVLDRGVVLKGDVMIGVAGVDLVYLQLQVILSAVENFQRERGELRP